MQESSCGEAAVGGGEGGGEVRKNSNTSTRKYTECLPADKPFAHISDSRLSANITRAVGEQRCNAAQLSLLSRPCR